MGQMIRTVGKKPAGKVFSAKKSETPPNGEHRKLSCPWRDHPFGEIAYTITKWTFNWRTNPRTFRDDWSLSSVLILQRKRTNMRPIIVNISMHPRIWILGMSATVMLLRLMGCWTTGVAYHGLLLFATFSLGNWMTDYEICDRSPGPMAGNTGLFHQQLGFTSRLKKTGAEGLLKKQLPMGERGQLITKAKFGHGIRRRAIGTFNWPMAGTRRLGLMEIRGSKSPL
jgi:hypothetical protein